mgnify:CR=1
MTEVIVNLSDSFFSDSTWKINRITKIAAIIMSSQPIKSNMMYHLALNDVFEKDPCDLIFFGTKTIPR